MYLIVLYRHGRVYDRETRMDTEGFDVSAYVQQMLAHGFGVSIAYIERDGYKMA